MADAKAAVDPWALIGGNLTAGLGKGLGDTIGGGGPFMGGDSKATYGDVVMDGSGWTVNIGSGSASTDNRQNKPSTRTNTDTSVPPSMGYLPGVAGNPGLGQYAGSPSQASINPLMLLLLVGVAVVATKKKGGG